jgi:FOG: WD40 repeat
VAEGTFITIYNSKVYLAGTGKDLQIYALPESDITEIDLRKLPPDPLDVLSIYKIPTSVISVSPNLKLMAVGCVDGTVTLINLQTGVKQNKQVHGSSGVQSLSFSADSNLLFSTGHERDFFAWNNLGKLFEKPVLSSAEDPSLETIENVEDFPDDKVNFITNILSEAKAKTEIRDIERVKSKQKARLQEIKDKLAALLKANDKAPDLEKLDRDEFVLDLEAKKKIEEKGRLAAEALKREAKKKNLAQELLQQRIKVKTLDSMEINSRVLSSFFKPTNCV